MKLGVKVTAITAVALASVACASSSTSDDSTNSKKLITEIDGSRRIRGLDPALADKYPLPSDIVPSPKANKSATFRCLDGSTTIAATSVNDDYCDCADGSDEPGTSACSTLGGGVAPKKTFHCVNKGHIPASIYPSRVNDGICDPECCDGSDEYDDEGKQCPDVCEVVGREHRAKTEALAKTRRTGAKIRSTYVSHANAERTRLEEELKRLEADVEEKRDAVQAAKTRLDRLESASAAHIERRKQSALYQSLLQHRDVLDRLKRQAEQSEKELELLRGILDELERGYNPNYQDMAVKAAVVGWQEYMGRAPSQSNVEDGQGQDQAAAAAAPAAVDVKDEDDDEPLVSSQELYELEKLDTVALLLADDDGQEGLDGASAGSGGGGPESTCESNALLGLPKDGKTADVLRFPGSFRFPRADPARPNSHSICHMCLFMSHQCTGSTNTYPMHFTRLTNSFVTSCCFG